MSGPFKGIDSPNRSVGQAGLQTLQAPLNGTFRSRPSSLSGATVGGDVFSGLRGLLPNFEPPVSSSSSNSTKYGGFARNLLSQNQTNQFRGLSENNVNRRNSIWDFRLDGVNLGGLSGVGHQQTPRLTSMQRARPFSPRRQLSRSRAAAISSVPTIDPTTDRNLYEFNSHDVNASSPRPASSDATLPGVTEASVMSVADVLASLEKKYPELAPQAREVNAGLSNLETTSTSLQNRIRVNQLEGVDKDINASIQQVRDLTAKVNSLQTGLKKHSDPGLASKFDEFHQQLNARANFLVQLQQAATLGTLKDEETRLKFAAELSKFSLKMAELFANLLNSIGHAMVSASR